MPTIKTLLNHAGLAVATIALLGQLKKISPGVKTVITGRKVADVPLTKDQLSLPSLNEPTFSTIQV